MKFLIGYKGKELPEGSDIESLVEKVADYIAEREGEYDLEEAQNCVLKTLPNIRPYISCERNLKEHLQCLAWRMSNYGEDPDTMKCWDKALEYLAKDVLRDRRCADISWL